MGTSLLREFFSQMKDHATINLFGIVELYCSSRFVIFLIICVSNLYFGYYYGFVKCHDHYNLSGIILHFCIEILYIWYTQPQIPGSATAISNSVSSLLQEHMWYKSMRTNCSERVNISPELS